MKRVPINSVLLRRIKEPVGVADGKTVSEVERYLLHFLEQMKLQHHCLENLYEDRQAVQQLADCPTLAFNTTYAYQEKTDALLQHAADLPDLWTVIVLGETAYGLAAQAILQRDAAYARRGKHAPAIELIGFDWRAWDSWHQYQVNSGEVLFLPSVRWPHPRIR